MINMFPCEHHIRSGCIHCTRILSHTRIQRDKHTHIPIYTHTRTHTYTSHILCDSLWLYWNQVQWIHPYRCWGFSMCTSACMDKTCLTPLYKDRRKTGWYLLIIIELIFLYIYIYKNNYIYIKQIPTRKISHPNIKWNEACVFWWCLRF